MYNIISHGMTSQKHFRNDSETLKTCTGLITPDVPNDIQGGRIALRFSVEIIFVIA